MELENVNLEGCDVGLNGKKRNLSGLQVGKVTDVCRQEGSQQLRDLRMVVSLPALALSRKLLDLNLGAAGWSPVWIS